MKRPTLRIALGAFVFGVELLRLFGVTLTPPPRLTPLRFTPPLVLTVPTTQPAPDPPGVQKMLTTAPAQEEPVWMPGMGYVKVAAYEPPGEQMRLVFWGGKRNEALLSVPFGEREENRYRKLRFRVLSGEGLPRPLVVGVGFSPGGSDATWEAKAVGVVGGELRELTDGPLRTSNQGGFYFGDLGGGRGFGAAAWDYVWDFDSEGHYGPHRYDVNFYVWDARYARFEWARGFRTARRFERPSAAMRGTGLGYRDLRLTFPELISEEIE